MDSSTGGGESQLKLFVTCASIICTCASNGCVLVPGHRSTTDLYLCRLFVPALVTGILFLYLCQAQIYLYLGTNHLYLGTDYLYLGQASRTTLFLKHRYTVCLCLGTSYLYLPGFVLVHFWICSCTCGGTTYLYLTESTMYLFVTCTFTPGGNDFLYLEVQVVLWHGQVVPSPPLSP